MALIFIDPWVHDFPGKLINYFRHWFSTKLAGLLEPIAVKCASLITRVAEGYYAYVIGWRSLTSKTWMATSYGGEILDKCNCKHIRCGSPIFLRKITKNSIGTYTTERHAHRRHMVPLENVELHCLPARYLLVKQISFYWYGKTPGDANGFNIKPLAEKIRTLAKCLILNILNAFPI